MIKSLCEIEIFKFYFRTKIYNLCTEIFCYTYNYSILVLEIHFVQFGLTRGLLKLLLMAEASCNIMASLTISEPLRDGSILTVVSRGATLILRVWKQNKVEEGKLFSMYIL